MPAYPAINTQVIGQAETALGAILGPILADARTSFDQWLVLTVTAGSGGSVDQDQLIGRVSSARKTDSATVLAAIGQLATSGLITVTPADSAAGTGPAVRPGGPEGSPASARLTASGQQRYQQIRDQIDAVTERLFGDLPATDLETAGRVLAIVTARANAELSASSAH